MPLIFLNEVKETNLTDHQRATVQLKTRASKFKPSKKNISEIEIKYAMIEAEYQEKLSELKQTYYALEYVDECDDEENIPKTNEQISNDKQNFKNEIFFILTQIYDHIKKEQKKPYIAEPDIKNINLKNIETEMRLNPKKKSLYKIKDDLMKAVDLCYFAVEYIPFTIENAFSQIKAFHNDSLDFIKALELQLLEAHNVSVNSQLNLQQKAEALFDIYEQTSKLIKEAQGKLQLEKINNDSLTGQQRLFSFFQPNGSYGQWKINKLRNLPGYEEYQTHALNM